MGFVFFTLERIRMMKNVLFVFSLIAFVCFAAIVEAGDCCNKDKVCCCEVKCCEDVCCRPTLAERVAERRAERACERAERVACRAERRAARKCCTVVCCEEVKQASNDRAFYEAVKNSTPCCGN